MPPKEPKNVLKEIYIFNAFLSSSPLQKDYGQVGFFLHRTLKVSEHASFPR